MLSALECKKLQVLLTASPRYVGLQRQGVEGVAVLTGPNAMQVSPDGLHVYVASTLGVSVFARDVSNVSSGLLSLVEGYDS